VTGTRRRAAAALLLLALVPVAAGCGGADDRHSATPGAATSSALRTLTPIPLPPPGPPSGELHADLRQSSRDTALGRMEVWIDNDTARVITPTRIRYRDARFGAPVAGERLRANPSQSERGYPLTLPLRPACGRPARAATVEVRYAGRTVTLPVSDDNDIVQRYVDSRCLELAMDRVASLHFSDRVSVDHPGEGSTAVLTLVARPTGRRGHVLVVDRVGGTPLFGAADGSDWAPGARVRGDGPVRRIELPVQPARCDDHVFLEAAGATAFLVTLHLDGRAGLLVVRMDPRGSAAAIAFARDSCGL
jgi:hypothetical protein